MLGISGIDHPVVAVRDMVKSHRRYQALGFTIPPRGSHLEWGTGNWCIMFPGNYLELRGIIDAERYTHHLDEFLAVREGLMGVAFSAKSADDAWGRGTTTGVPMTEPRELTRRFELPEGDSFPKFRLTFMEPDNCPGLMRSLVCQHLTPELIRRPEWLIHPNGVTRIARVTIVTDDLSAAKARYVQAFGNVFATAESTFTVGFPDGTELSILTPDAASLAGLDVPGVARPYLAALTLDVENVEATARLMTANQVAFLRPSPDVVRIAADDACGAVLDFQQS